MTGSYSAVARAIADHLARETAPNDDMEHIRRSADFASPREDWVARPARDYSGILAPAIAAGRTGTAMGIASALAALPRPLFWHYHYAPRPGEADLAERIAFAELIGPDGPLMAPACRIGFTLMAADTFYPLHTHPAVELYLVIAGEAEWTMPGIARRVPPGGYVLHPTGVPHAMRTFGEPLLALYGWRGDIDSPAVYL